ncbi:transmembrane protein 100-like [Epinephelus fuscoguttatus]|uniref:transmembrane protein 100-like n=1 Tax=Epinephelus fuscoguttatus TaxID=293821 RepID=UPI0020D05B2F|nr:transmembrane protein 100-like [Epinephelus fuscoguttatus]XP_049439723.1 transmembrane protein 100-like [Epinephelus fuscoguttatus]
MANKLETLDPSTLSDATSTVTYDPKSQTVTLPEGVVSVAGITVMTGGVELSCGSCMLAFGFWGTLIGFSCVAVGLWDQLNQSKGGTSHLLALGLVILGLSFAVVGSVVAFYLLTRKKREMKRGEREDGKEVLVESGRVIKKVTV